MTTWLTSTALLFVLSVGSAVSTGWQLGGRPDVLQMKAPEYPAIAHAAHASGSVIVEVEVDSAGDVISARATSGHPLLRSAAVKAAQGWKFATRGANTRFDLQFDFVEPDLVSLATDPSRCRDGFIKVDPYHLQVYGYLKVEASTVADQVPKELLGTACPVHHQLLQRDRVPIEYGLAGFKPGYPEAEKNLFPNANTISFGGCVIETVLDSCSGKEIQISPKYADVLYCPACRRAAKNWSKSHQDKADGK